MPLHLKLTAQSEVIVIIAVIECVWEDSLLIHGDSLALAQIAHHPLDKDS